MTNARLSVYKIKETKRDNRKEIFNEWAVRETRIPGSLVSLEINVFVTKEMPRTPLPQMSMGNFSLLHGSLSLP